MENWNFQETIIIVLIALLFGKETLLPAILKKFGFKNGNNYQSQIDELRKHASVANQEMGEIKADISTIKQDISYIRGKIS